MATTSKTKVRNAMGRKHKTVKELAVQTCLSEGEVKRVLRDLVADGYTAQDPEGYRRIRMPRKKPR